jgi:hypothetical protein
MYLWVKSFLAWLGAAGAIYTVGFIIEAAHQSLLGIALPADTTGYIVEAGRLGLDILGLTLSPLFLWVPVVAWLAGAGIVVVLAMKRIRRVQDAILTPALVYTLGWLVVLVVSVVVTVAYGLPFVRIDNLLFRSLAKDFDKQGRLDVNSISFGWTGPIERRTVGIYQDLVCAQDASACGGAKVNTATYQERINKRFFWQVVLTGWVVLAGTLHLGHRPNAPGQVATFTETVAICSMAVAVLMVPYVYGKTFRSRAVEEVIVDCGEKMRCGDGPKRSSLSNVSANLDAGRAAESTVFTEMHGYMLARSDKSVIVFRKESENLWNIPIENLVDIRVEGFGDPFRHRIERMTRGGLAPAIH